VAAPALPELLPDTLPEDGLTELHELTSKPAKARLIRAVREGNLFII